VLKARCETIVKMPTNSKKLKIGLTSKTELLPGIIIAGNLTLQILPYSTHTYLLRTRKPMCDESFRTNYVFKVQKAMKTKTLEGDYYSQAFINLTRIEESNWTDVESSDEKLWDSDCYYDEIF
jgi:hypothetical protein